LREAAGDVARRLPESCHRGGVLLDDQRDRLERPPGPGDAVTEITRLKTGDAGSMDVGGAAFAAAAISDEEIGLLPELTNAGAH
jgi:hypothetical protein